jgi:hypothetical protein
MSAAQTQQARPAHLPPMTDEELERDAIRELERMERALNAKKSGYKPRRRRNYADHR